MASGVAVIRLSAPRAGSDSEVVDFEARREVLGSGAVDALLSVLRTAPEYAGMANVLQRVHRQLRADHIPTLVEIAHAGHRIVSDEAFEEVAGLAQHSDRHRRHVARLFAGDPETLEFWSTEAESNCCRVVPVKRVIEEFVHERPGDLLHFQSGSGATLAQWLRDRFEPCGGVAFREAADGYVLGVR